MSVRRLMPFALVLLSVAACGGGDGPTSPEPDPEPDPTASSISLSPGSATSSALEDTTEFSATVRDQDGTTMSGVTVSWSSSDASVVSVSSSGEAVAEANGSADVIASAEGLADTASVTVDQAADQVDVTPVVDTLTAGDSLQLSASAADANGHPVAEAEFAWSSSDEAVATVDSTGFVRTQSDGPVSVTSEIDGVSAASDLTVEPAGGPAPADAPTVSSVSPSPLPEGGTATISGSDFATTPDSNTVHVDGVETAVLSATSTSLEIDVPLYDCLPARDVFVAVETSAGADSAGAALEPDETPVQLAVGEQTLVEDPSAFCLQFEATSTSSSYLLGIQSASDVASALTSASVFAVTGTSSSLEQVQTLSLRDAGLMRGAGQGLDPDPRLDAHAEAELRRMRAAREFLEGRATSSRPYQQAHGMQALREAALPESVAVGDSVDLTIGASDNVCQIAASITGVVRHIGNHGIWITDVDNPSGGYTDTELQQYADEFDGLSYPTDTTHFGSPPDTDGNGRVALVITQEVNRQGGALGFVSPGDFFTTSECAASNEGEYTYLLAPDPNGTVGPVTTVSYLLENQPRTIAHELVHIIQTGRRLTSGQPPLDVWQLEGQAVFGEEVVGHEATGRTPGSNYGLTAATYGNSSGDGLTPWYWNGFTDLARYFGFEDSETKVAGAPEECGWLARDWAGGPCIGPRSVYGTPWSFLRWATDHYGASYPGGQAGFHRDLIGSAENGFALIESLTGARMEEMLAHWAASLYVDDRIALSDPLLSQPSWNFHEIYEALVESAQLVPVDAPFADFEATGSVRAASAGYLRISDTSRPPTAVRVRTTTDGTLPASMQIWLVRLE